MKKIILALLLSIFNLVVFARAGGGGHSSGGSGGGGGFGGGYYYGYHHGHSPHNPKEVILGMSIAVLLALILILTTIFGLAVLVRKNHKKTKAKIAESKKFDAFWDEEKMCSHVHEIFPKIQAAWMSRELKDVSELVTPRFIGTFQPLLNTYKKKRILNVIDNIRLEEVKIVDIHDNTDDNKDGFAVYLKGHMRDFLVLESGGFTGVLGDNEINEFEDLYIFKREKDHWLLDYIVNDPQSRDFKLGQYGFGQ